MRKGENPSEVLKAVKARVKELNDTILPKGVSIVPYYDRTFLIETTLHTVFKNLLEGAKVYKSHCAVCHGLPDVAKTAIAEGMAPKPPQLFKGVGVTDDEAWESYWKVKNGIRMTGMPGFKGHLTETEIWLVTVLVKNADKITPAVKVELTGSPTALAAPSVRVEK